MEFWTEYFILVSIFAVAIMSPGPDFLVAVRNSSIKGRMAGIGTAIGIALGTCVHVSYCVLGIAVLISQSVLLFNAIKWIGAGYLIYIGIRALTAKHESPATMDQGLTATASAKPMSLHAGIGSGFLTNLLNPKATMFFLALFTQVIDPHTPVTIQVFYGLTCSVMALSWFSLVSVVLTNAKVRSSFLNCAKWIDRVSGGFFIALGAKLALFKMTV